MSIAAVFAAAVALTNATERFAALNAKFAPSCAAAHVWLRPGVPPSEQSWALSRWERESLIKKNAPLVLDAYAVAADRFLVHHRGFTSNEVDRIEIVFGGGKYPAKAVRRCLAMNATELQSERPVAGVKPLEFSKRLDFSRDEGGAWYGAQRQNGVRDDVFEPAGWKLRRYAPTGVTYRGTPGDRIAVNASNEAVTVWFHRNAKVDETFPPPAEWRWEPAAAVDESRAAMKRRIRRGLVSLYFHVDSESNRKDGWTRRYGSYSDDSGKTEIDAVGLALAGGEVLVPLSLDASKMSEIDQIKAVLPDGRKLPLEFLGAFREHKLVMLKFPDGRLPDGVEPFAFDAQPCERRYLEWTWGFNAANGGGDLTIQLSRARLREFRYGAGAETVPAFAGGDSVLLSDDGAFMGEQVERRSAERYGNDEQFLTAAALKAMAAEKDFDPQFAIRKGKDRIRIAWIGVETQRVTEELAREKKVTQILREARSAGAIVTTVRKDTPADRAGIRAGDVLLAVRNEKGTVRSELADGSGDTDFDFGWFFVFGGFDFGRAPWPDVEGGVNQAFTRIGIGRKVIVTYARDGVRREAALVLEQAPTHYQTARQVKVKALGIKVADLTFEVRTYFKLADDAPGVVISKIQPGNPAAIGGLRPLEIITHVNAEPVTGAKDFAKKVKGAKNLTFSVRRLAETRVVRIELSEKKEEKDAKK